MSEQPAILDRDEIPDRMWNSRQVAEIFCLSPLTVARKTKAGAWPGRKVGRGYLFTRDDLDQILRQDFPHREPKW